MEMKGSHRALSEVNRCVMSPYPSGIGGVTETTDRNDRHRFPGSREHDGSTAHVCRS
jgi:hypothetical protein